MNDKLVYSSEKEGILTIYTKRANAPERGDVFTAKAIEKVGKRDLIIDVISNHTGYIKKNLKDYVVAIPGNYYRFKIVGGPYCKNRHNYYSAIAVRELGENESRALNKIDGQNALLVERLAEFVFGYGWDRRNRKHYRLNESQKNWDWFKRNFM